MKRGILKIYCDGGARGNPGPSAAAFVVIKGTTVEHKATEYLGERTNNEAEYAAVIMALSWLSDNKRLIAKKEVVFYLDSELVAKQLSGEFKIKSKKLLPKFLSVKKLEKVIGVKIGYVSVPREKNRLADFLVNKILDQKK
ncbi:ribonuclease HI family protein [Patescibacteria group bacterium]|nr:ribonuclease HI family protein [Patescibacteria group bacterium]